MKVAYVFHQNNKYTYAADTIALGFKRVFLDIGAEFRFFNTAKLSKLGFEKLKLRLYDPDLIFTSMENIHLLPLDSLKQKKLVLWGQFYTPCNYEEQLHAITAETKSLLNKYKDKHDILVWSQHDDDINDQFFSEYEKELGLKFIQLLHGADKTLFLPPLAQPTHDFIWIGNIWHRKTRYNATIEPLKKDYPNFWEFTEHARLSPDEILAKQLYRQSYFAPNIHTDAQVQYRILINERVFSSSIQGAFQICDNPLARKYFSEEELIIAQHVEDYREILTYFKNHPKERLNMINRMTKKILKEHTYHHRVYEIFRAYRIHSPSLLSHLAS